MNILVTGGAGFIGSALIKQLLTSHTVVCVDNFNDYYDPLIKRTNIKPFEPNQHFHLVEADLLDEETINQTFEQFDIDVLVHLAARAGVRPSIEDPMLYQRVNNEGTQVLFEMAKHHNIKHMIAASSSSVYGNTDSVPFKESDPVDRAISPYAATKKANEVMGHVYYSLYDINMVFLRFFTVYGPSQRPDLAIHKFTRMILNGETLPFYGDGTSARDYTYIDDIVDGIVRAIDYSINNENIYEIINLGNSYPVTLASMLKTIENTLGKQATIEKMAMPAGDVKQTFADITKAKTLLGYEPKTTFEDGIEAFVKWYKNTHPGAE